MQNANANAFANANANGYANANVKCPGLYADEEAKAGNATGAQTLSTIADRMQVTCLH